MIKIVKRSNSKNKKKTPIIGVFVAAFALCLVLGSILLTKAEEPAQTVYITTPAELTEYAYQYSLGNRNRADKLVFSLNNALVLNDSDFISIGTSSRPFEGTLVLPVGGGIDTFALNNCALFDYVSTDMKVEGGNIKISRAAVAETPGPGVFTSGALFANHVVAGTNAANWTIISDPLPALYTGSAAATDHQGLIGELGANAEVNVTFTNNTDMNVVSDKHAGLICGTLGQNAKLTINLTTPGASGDLSVTTTSGDAGGLVGRLGVGASLTINSENICRVNAVTTSGSGNFAGGIVGYVNGAEVKLGDSVSSYGFEGTVTGGTGGAGGLFGYYKDSADSPVTFALEKFVPSGRMLVYSNGSSGGIFGTLENTAASFTFDGFKSSSKEVDVYVGSGQRRGGVCGSYKTNSLSNTFTVTDTKVTYKSSVISSNCSGGIIGYIESSTGSSAAYIDINDVEVISRDTETNAGIIGHFGTLGSFVDITGDIKISGKLEAGIAASIPSGVLRLSHLTDTSELDASKANLVKNRNRGLVYALGNGSDEGWTFYRFTNKQLDDIYEWGQVLRVDGTKLKESDLFTVDSSAHTVTVKSAVTTMNNVTAFAKTALNIKLGTDNDIGALKFQQQNKSGALLSGNLSITNDIDLSGTGLVGLTRDDGKNNAYSGTFNGNNKKITFATGETYGKGINGADLDAYTSPGRIFNHAYNGLFAETSGATVQNLKLEGSALIQPTIADAKFGGVTAYAEKSLTLNNVSSNMRIDFRTGANNMRNYFGGYVGYATGSALDINITDCGNSSDSDYLPTVTDHTTDGINGSLYYATFVGGVIGFVNDDDGVSQSIDIQDSYIGLKKYERIAHHESTKNTNRVSAFGGAIGGIGSENSVYVKGKRTVNLSDCHLFLDADGVSKDRKFGAILGMDWYASDVTVSGLDVNATSIKDSVGNADYGGLVQTATGYWDVQSIDLTSCSFDLANNSNSTFGFVVNKTSKKSGTENRGALYLDVDNTGSNYNIGNLTFMGSPSFTYFDEVCADSRYAGNTDISANRHSIISVTTSADGYIASTDGGYLNKTAYGMQDVATHTLNAHTRYYYNLKYARSYISTPKFKFLIWSVRTYADDSLRLWFNVDNTNFTGDLDMTGLSYYPVSLRDSISFTNADLKLDNIEMESRVEKAYSGASQKRTTRANTNQHYLMHTAVILNNYGHSISVSGSADGLKMSGNVPKLSNDHCGFLVARNLSGTDDARASFTASKLVFDGVRITTSTGGDLTTDVYAPLLINKIGRKTSLTINSAIQAVTGYPSFTGKFAGSSLIGNVGDDPSAETPTARSIYLTFKDLEFDARISNIETGLDFYYGTERSIFSRATILNSFRYLTDCAGTYNYYVTEDWNDNGNAVHKVTYGKEVTDSQEYRDTDLNVSLERHYYGSEYFTNPQQRTDTTEYSFSSGWRPYVYIPYNVDNRQHELSVNVSVNNDIEGCGKYDDPYIIDDGEKLNVIAKIIAKKDEQLDSVTIWFPNDLSSYNYTDSGYTKYEYAYNSTTLTSSNGGANLANNDVRRYLAGAYYKVTEGITLPADYTPLGDPMTNSPEYAFRGLIIGADGGKTITNNSPEPLIRTSHGCVVKDINITVNVTKDNTNEIVLTAPHANDKFDYIDGIISYGAVIGQILGGDTVIDNVDVSFQNAVFNLVSSSNTYTTLTPIGGYVGTLLNGGLIFKNMTSGNVGLSNGTFSVNNTSAGNLASSDSGYLYVNPIIGRVVAGYAFHDTTYSETPSYHATEAETTLKNGTKNYSISDLSQSAGKLKISVNNKDDQFTIDVPDGQAMYVLGAIVNSGAGSAAVNTNGTNNPYDSGNTLTNNWLGYGPHTTTRGNSGYSTTGTISGDDYTAATIDRYSADKVQIPYIIRYFTTSFKGNADMSSRFYARSITYLENNVVKVSGYCNVAEGFRGISSIYLDNKLVRLSINSFDGNNTSTNESNTINLNMHYIEYDHMILKDSIYIPPKDTSKRSPTAGFGLFNRVVFNSAKESNSIKNITLSGSVFYDILKIDGTECAYNFSSYSDDKYETGSPNNNTEDVVNRTTHLSTGGLIGIATSKYYILNVVFNNLSVEGAYYAGGLIGYSSQKDGNISYIKYTSSAGTSGTVNVTGGIAAGGLIGRIFDTRTEIIGDSTGYTDIVIGNIEMKASDPNETGLKYFANLSTGVGGLIGSVWNGRGGDGTNYRQDEEPMSSETQARRLYINNINVKGNGTGCVSVTNNTYSSLMSNYAGGMIGSAHNVPLHVFDCKVSGVNVDSYCSGGVIGRVSQRGFIYIKNTTIDGASNSASIKGTRFAGGTIGWFNAHDEVYLNYDNLTIKDYDIEAKTIAKTYSAAGGLIGFAESDNMVLNEKRNHTCPLTNIVISGCLIKTNYETDYEPKGITSQGTGGLIGTIDKTIISEPSKSGNGEFKFSGYNILIDSVELVHLNKGTTNDSSAPNNKKIGDIIGFGPVTNGYYGRIKFVGVTTNYPSGYTYCGKHFGGQTSDASLEQLQGDNYIVFADFGASTESNTFPAIGSYTNVDVAYPYVTVNPKETVGNVALTSDGVASDVDSLPIKAIINDGARYKHALTSIYSGTSTNLAIFANYSDKFAMYKSEINYSGNDFPVLIVDSLERSETHNMINSYLRLLTNTTYDFGSDNYSAVFDVSIYNMKYSPNEGKFVVDGTPSLKRTNGQFYMVYNSVDSGEGKVQFSLIDVAFFDPLDDTKTAYHLYVPVFVKKVLSYRFEISALSGTRYLESLYEPGKAVIENIGTPVTMYFKYIYSRTPSEWAAAINGGESVIRNYAKSLSLSKANTTSILKYLPGDTVLVLVDPGQGGKAYYSTVGIAMNYQNYSESMLEQRKLTTIDFSTFRSELSLVNGTYVPSGDYFTPRNFSDMMDISVSLDEEGTLVPVTGSEEPSVEYNNIGYRIATSEELADSTVEKYKATVSGSDSDLLEESYYLSFITEGGENYDKFHYFVATAPYAFSDPEYPSKIESIGPETMVHYITGKIFDHDNLSLYTDSYTGPDIITASNNKLEIDMEVSIGLSDDLGIIKTDMQNFIRAVDVYQSYLVYLTKREGINLSKVILGPPDASGSKYSIVQTTTGNEPAGSYIDYGTADYDVGQRYAQFTSPNLKDYLSTGYKYKIISHVTLEYTASQIPTQFPGRNSIAPNDGVTVSCASHVSFSKSEVEYSKNSISRDDQNERSYYSDTDPEYALLDLNPIGDRLGDFTPLGINALNIEHEDQNHASFDLLPVLEVSPIVNEIDDYASAEITVELSQKNTDGRDYGDPLDISDYLTVYYEGGSLAGTSYDANSAHMNVDKSLLVDTIAEITFPELHFTVETGELLESKGHFYSNYKITVTVALKDEYGVVYKISRASNYVIYTNAKIIPDFIVLNQDQENP